MFFFGPESERQIPDPREPVLRPSSSHQAPSPEATSLQVPKKHGREGGPNGLGETTPQPTAKRPRKSTNVDRNGQRKTSAPPVVPPGSAMEVDVMNGHPASAQDMQSPAGTEGPEENGVTVNGVRQDDRMEVDTDGELQADAPTDAIPAVIHTLNTGESVGIQVAPAKIADLVPSTAILDAPGDNQLTRSLWSPHEQSMLTSRGDTTCGLWRDVNNTSKPVYHELLGYRDGDDSLVTALAWEPTGSVLAVATCSQGFGELHLFDGRSLDLLETLPASQRVILQLQFQSSGFRLVGLAPYDDDSASSSILLWDMANGLSAADPLSLTVPETLEDIDCVVSGANAYVWATGGQAVYQCRAFSELKLEHKFSSASLNDSARWAFVKSAWRSPADSLLVAASSGEIGSLWLPAKNILRRDAHQAAITGLQIRPAPAIGSDQRSTTDFATSSEDGSVKIWRVEPSNNSLHTTVKLTFGQPMFLKTLSYSPDGFCLAAASNNSVRIWNAEHGYNQMAVWQGPVEWKGNHLKDEDMMSNGAMSSNWGDGNASALDHCLTWDPDSKKLAFSLGSQVSCFTHTMHSRLTVAGGAHQFPTMTMFTCPRL